MKSPQVWLQNTYDVSPKYPSSRRGRHSVTFGQCPGRKLCSKRISAMVSMWVDITFLFVFALKTKQSWSNPQRPPKLCVSIAARSTAPIRHRIPNIKLTGIRSPIVLSNFHGFETMFGLPLAPAIIWNLRTEIYTKNDYQAARLRMWMTAPIHAHVLLTSVSHCVPVI
jgi:hypothetical protein